MKDKKYVISVGAGKNQVCLIKRLVERGYNVISFDKNINSPGKKLSYMFNNISTWHYGNAIQWLDSLKLNFKGALCFSYGKALISQQKIIDHYSMNCKINNSFINIMEDKSFQRKILRNFNLSTIKEYNNYCNVIHNEEYKNFIIKDKMGGSSNNIFLVENKCYDHNIVEKLFKNGYIIQEYLNGTEYRIITLVEDKEIKFISIMKRNNLQKTFFTGRLNPKSSYDKEIVLLIEKIIQKFRIIDSVLKIDVIKGENRIEILEIDFGIGGDYFETIISPKCYSYDFIDNYINLMLGLPVDEKKTLDNELCFDYIYNINKKENLIIDYNKIFDIADKYFSEYDIVNIKEQGQLVQYPRSNMDAILGIVHNRKDLSNYDVNILFNKVLSK